MSKVTWTDILQNEIQLRTMKASQRTARAAEQIAQDQPRLAYEQGWREGWQAGYAAAMEKKEN